MEILIIFGAIGSLILSLMAMSKYISHKADQMREKDPGLDPHKISVGGPPPTDNTVHIKGGIPALIFLLTFFGCLAVMSLCFLSYIGYMGRFRLPFFYRCAMFLALVLSIGFTAAGFVRLHRFKKKAGKSAPGAAVVCLLVSLLVCGLFVFEMPRVNDVVEKQLEITDITQVYNKDGTKKYDSDGNPVLKNHYGDYQVTHSYGINYMCLVYTVALFFLLRSAYKNTSTKGLTPAVQAAKPAKPAKAADPAPKKTPRVTKCPYCGTGLRPGAKFCDHCGKSIQ